MSWKICIAASHPALREQSRLNFPQLLWPSLSILSVQTIHLLPYSLQAELYWASWLVSGISLASYPLCSFLCAVTAEKWLCGRLRLIFCYEGYKLDRKGRKNNSVLVCMFWGGKKTLTVPHSKGQYKLFFLCCASLAIYKNITCQWITVFEVILYLWVLRILNRSIKLFLY